MIMESWSYVSGGGKGFVSSETISNCDTFSRSKNAMVGWDLKGPCGFGNNGLFLGQKAMEFRGFGEMCSTELLGDELPDTIMRDALSFKPEAANINNPFTVSTNSFGLGDDSVLQLSSSAVDFDGEDSCIFNLKLGKFGDPRDSKISGGKPIMSSSGSSTPPKRSRVGLNAHTAHCQVYGCNKDLSSSKEYHKRHKVCELHTKTAKVIVNGIVQRFCQQCSRFHLLEKFDNGKRSCRKRLQGHNERRRKPQVGIHSGRADINPSCLLYAEKYGTNAWSKHVKPEDGASFSLLSAIPIIGSIYNGNPNDIGAPSSVARPLFQDTSLENKDFTAFDATSTVKGLSEITYSGCALSLLSPRSSNSSTHSSGISAACPLLLSGNNSYYCMNQASEKLKGASSQASNSVATGKFASSGMVSVDDGYLRPILISNGSDAINFMDGVYHGSHLVNANDHISSKDGSTINLLQLSSELQRVELQKQTIKVKQETDAFCGPRVT